MCSLGVQPQGDHVPPCLLQKWLWRKMGTKSPRRQSQELRRKMGKGILNNRTTVSPVNLLLHQDKEALAAPAAEFHEHDGLMATCISYPSFFQIGACTGVPTSPSMLHLGSAEWMNLSVLLQVFRIWRTMDWSIEKDCLISPRNPGL